MGTAFVLNHQDLVGLPTPCGRKRLVRGAVAGAAIAFLASGLTLAAGAQAAGAGPLHTMAIDATALSTDALNIVGITTAPLSTTSVITVDLPTGVTTFNAGGAAFFCQPSVTPGGTWELPASCSGVASDAGTSTLVLTGRPITLGTATLSTGVDPLLYGNFVVGAGTAETFTWMPQPPVEMVVGSALPSRCEVGLATDGNVTLERCRTSAIVSGATVRFVGFPFSFDARPLSTSMYVIEAMDLDHEVTPSSTVHAFRLMAANGYGMQVGAAIVASFHWGIGPAGLVTYPAADSTFLSGRGTDTLVINGLPATINATGLGSGTFTLGPDVFGPSFDQSAPQNLHLVPGVYEFGSEGLPAPEWFAWALSNTDAARFVSGQAHPCAYVSGPALVVDCSPPTFTEVSGAPNWSDNRGTFVVTGQECYRVADVHATGIMTFTDVTTGADLGTVTLVASTKYANCGEAIVTDDEHLPAGNYRIKALYTPSGAIPVPASAPASYRQRVEAT
jgi:hypothetical protein